MGITPEYTKRAIEKYNSKFDKIMVRLPSGYGDIIRCKIGMSGNAYINNLVRADFARRGLLTDAETIEATPAADPQPESGKRPPSECPF